MVMYTVNYPAGSYTLSEAPPVAKVLTQVSSGGQTDYFFTGTNVYNATMFALQQPGGDWFGTLFYGRTAIGADGQVGFLPDAQIEGNVRGVSVDAFAVDYVARRGSDHGLQKVLFAGDDTLIGNGYPAEYSGFGGDDLIIANLDYAKNLGFLKIDGGTGNDVLHATSTALKYHVGVTGGFGDDFIFMSDARIAVSANDGVDTLFYERLPDTRFTDSVLDFQNFDLVQLSSSQFTSLSNGFGESNFEIGSKANDSDDFIIFDGQRLFYDQDGNGPQPQVALAYFVNGPPVNWTNIVVSDAVPAAGDHDTVFPAYHENRASALHAGIHGTGLLP